LVEQKWFWSYELQEVPTWTRPLGNRHQGNTLAQIGRDDEI
jgi:hypothetical protein